MGRRTCLLLTGCHWIQMVWWWMNQVWSPVFVLKHSILPETPISMHINVYKSVHLTVRIRSSYFLWGCQLSSLVGNLLSFTSQSSLPKSCGEEEKWHIQLQFKDLNWQHVISSEPWTRNGMGIFPTTFQPHDVRDMQKVCVCVCVCDEQGGSQTLCFHAPGLT